MSFCTAVNCMDGRVQLPVINYLMGRFEVTFVDSVTEPGPVAVLAEMQDSAKAQSILERIDVSVKKHKSLGIAVIAHYDCAGNPVSKEVQIQQLKIAADFIRSKYPEVETIGLWVDENWLAGEVSF